MAEVTVSAIGLGRIIDDLYDVSSLNEMIDGMRIRVRPHRFDDERYVVNLDKHQYKYLLGRIQHATLENWYGPKNG